MDVKYADAYSKILSAKGQTSFFHIYVDAFAGAGAHRSRESHELVQGSPLNALAVQPQFREFHLIDIAPEKIETLRELVGSRKDVFIYQGDCN
jgi:three-Cys-motif partner protein